LGPLATESLCTTERKKGKLYSSHFV